MDTSEKPKTKKNISISATDRENLFIEFYVGEAYMNAAKAARLAGYSQPARDGWRLKKRKRVADAIKKRLEDAAMTSGEIIRRMSDYARGTFAPFLYGDDDEGPTAVDRDAEPIEVRAAKELLKRAEKPKPVAAEPDRLSWNDPTPEQIEAANKTLEEIAAKEDKSSAETIDFRLNTRVARANIHLLREIKVTKNTTKVTKKNGEVIENGTVQLSFKLHDAKDANKWLGQVAGLVKDSGSDIMKWVDVSKLSTRQLERLKAGEDLLKILLAPDGSDATGEELGEVEDDLPDAI